MRQLMCLSCSIILLLLSASTAFSVTSTHVLSPHEVQSLKEQGKFDGIEIRLANVHFDPLKSLPILPDGLRHIQALGAGGPGYYIVQFDGPIERSWKDALDGLGVETFDYIPDFAFIARMDAAKEGAVRSQAHVRWLGVFEPAYKVSQPASDLSYNQLLPGPLGASAFSRLLVSVFPGEDIARIRASVNGLEGIIVDEVGTKWETTLKIEISPENIAALSGVAGVKWIEPEPRWKLNNNVSTDIMDVRAPRDSFGLYGAGQTIGVADTGLDTGSIATLHLDFSDGAGASRVLSLIDLAGDGADDVNSGHGTHVAGSVLGSGVRSGCVPASDSFPDTCMAGIAPKAALVFQATENNSTGALSGIPTNLYTLFTQAQTAGAGLHTNSWGSSVQGMYTASSQYVDQYMWDHQDFLILYSAGNDGIDMDRDGVIDMYSLGSPATAKNCLTVGASEGYRPSGAGYDSPWGTGSWLNKYYVDPILSDHVSDDPNGMAAFSSRGPTLDGRYKPDVVAPGTNILSTRSSVASGALWGAYDTYYTWSGGTSMSTPLTAGTAALMREYLMGLTPSAALIKAALINSAADIYPGQYGTGPTQEITETVPNNVEGWGRVDLGNGVYPAAPYNVLYDDNQTGLSTGESVTHVIRVDDSNKPLKVHLVWTDYPGSPVAQGGLVNDLDLTVTDPGSGVHYPDNAVQKAAVNTISYNTGLSTVYSSNDRRAIRFTPSSYPANLDSASFWFANPGNTSGAVDVVVYAADGPGGLPGTQLFIKTLAYVSTGWHSIGIAGVVINSGDFYVSIEITDTTQGIYVDQDGNPTGRSYYYYGATWVLSGWTAYILATVRGNDYSTSYDRTNNVEGVTIDNPVAGTYTIQVNAYNIPYGPQPCALVASGDITDSVPITVSTDPAGRQIVVDSTPYAAPQTFSWFIGSNHTVDAASPQAGATGTRYVYSSWSDGGAQGHTLTTPASPTAYTANFSTQYELTTTVSPPASGSVTQDCSGGCWYNSGSPISLSPTPAGSNTFSLWTGDIDSLNAPLALVMDGPKNITAVFNSVAVTGTVRIAGITPVYYDSIPLAYAAAVDNDVIQMQAASYGGPLNYNRTDIPGLSVTLKGGYNETYSDNTDTSIVGGPFTVQSGIIIVDRIGIQ